MRFALIKNGVVEQIILADAQFVAENFKDYVAVEVDAKPGSPGPGWFHDGKAFTEPDPVVITPDEDLKVGGIKLSDADLDALALKLNPKLKALPADAAVGDVVVDPVVKKP